jgi:DNA-binding Lrp family transcriptional regulator
MKGDSLSAELTWFHVFKAMIDNGELKKMGTSAFATYCVIKSHANFSTGIAFPSITTICEKSGISERQVKTDLVTLEKLGYIIREKVGRNNRYILREKVLITDETGKPAGQATWDYLPDGVRAAVADLKNVLMSGSFADAKIVHIDNLQLQVVVINAESGSTQNVMGSGKIVNKNGKQL